MKGLFCGIVSGLMILGDWDHISYFRFWVCQELVEWDYVPAPLMTTWGKFNFVKNVVAKSDPQPHSSFLLSISLLLLFLLKTKNKPHYTALFIDGGSFQTECPFEFCSFVLLVCENIWNLMVGCFGSCSNWQRWIMVPSSSNNLLNSFSCFSFFQ